MSVYTKEQVDYAIRIKAEYTLNKKKITYQQIGKMTGMPKTKIEHIFRKKSKDLPRYEELLRTLSESKNIALPEKEIKITLKRKRKGRKR